VQTPFGVQMQQMEVQIDEELLQQIAEATDGKYFRAEDNEMLKEVYNEIDEMEKSKIDIQEFKRKHEEFLRFAIAALMLLALEIGLRFLVFKKFP
jgi:Ca-activated chloride channel family protein